MTGARPGPGRDGIAAYYDRLAPVYGDGELFGARRAAVLAEIAGDLGSADRVLDLGCGNGAFTAALAALAPNALIVGADLSPQMLRHAWQRAGGRIPLLRADAGALPFRPASLGVVFMSHVLLLIPDIERCIASIAGHLSVGGKLVATVGAGEWRTILTQFLEPEDLRALAELFGARESQQPDREERVAAACAAAGLQPTWRRTSFAVTGATLEEWVRIRWLTVLDAAQQAPVASRLARLRERAADLTLRMSETILVATKP